MTTVKIENINIKACADTGSQQNLIGEDTFKKIQDSRSRNNKIKLSKPDITLRPYCTVKPIPIVGKFEAVIETTSKITVADVYVVEGKADNLLSKQTSVDLDLVKINIPQQQEIGNVVSDQEPVFEKYPKAFKGIGKLKDKQVAFHINKSVAPQAQRYRKTPFPLRKKIEEKLKELEDNDIIEPATGPTPWVSPLVATPKPRDPSDIRLCVDMRAANKAILRERHDTPTIDELIAELSGAKIFSKVDLKSGYHQLELDEESRYITTFATHVGLKRYKRLSFGISSAAEVFQNTIRQVIEDIPGVLNVSDDILIYGHTQSEHDANLTSLLERLTEKGLTLNKAKCEFNKTKIEFFGLVFSGDGASADPEKVDAIRNAPHPKSADEISSLLGMAQYCSRFIPNLATITEPLRVLTHKGAKFECGECQEKAFTLLKKSLSSNRVMAYFDPQRATEIWVDASPVGLGAILTQTDKYGNRRNVRYVSRALQPQEQRYSQIEREALAIEWSVDRFRLYVLGGKFKVYSDHKPLVPIFNKPTSKASSRIQSWLLKLQAFDMEVQYKPGKKNPADFMSRHPTQEAPIQNSFADEYVNFIATNATPKGNDPKPY